MVGREKMNKMRSSLLTYHPAKAKILFIFIIPNLLFYVILLPIVQMRHTDIEQNSSGLTLNDGKAAYP